MRILPSQQHRYRLFYIVLFIIIVLLGIYSRYTPYYKSSWLIKYTGDVLYAMMFYCVICIIRPITSRYYSAIIGLLICITIELLKLWHVPWLNNVRLTSIGRLALGMKFDPVNFVCYLLGIGFMILLEVSIDHSKFIRRT